MAVAEAPASNVPPEWNADPDPIEEAPQPGAAAAPAGALAKKREEAKAPKAEAPAKEEAPTPVTQKQADMARSVVEESEHVTKPKPAVADHPPEWDAEPDQIEQAPAPGAAAPPAGPGGLVKAKDTVAAWIKGSITGGLVSEHSGMLITGAAAKALDTIHNALSYVYRKDGEAPGGHTEAQDAWFSHTVDPIAAKKADLALGPNATFAEKAAFGTAETLNMVLQAVATSGDAAPGELATIGGRALFGAKSMTVPAAINAVDVGNQVKQATGDNSAAAVAAAATFTTTAASGAAPMAFGRGFFTRAATGAAVAPVLGEAQRQASNLAMPADLTPEQRREADAAGTAKHEDLQQPFDPMQAEIQAIQGAAFGGLVPHGPVREAHSDVNELAQAHAAEIVKEGGGDNLEQVVAATHVAATVGAEHDAAAVHQARMEVRRAQVEEDTQNTMAAHEAFQREQDASAAERQKAEQEGAKPVPRADQAFDAREKEQAAAEAKTRDQDFTKAKNQVGDQQVNNAEGEVKGGAGEAPATVADALPPEQVSALGALRERLRQQRENPEPEAPKPAEEPAEVNRHDIRAGQVEAEQLAEEGAAKVAEASRPKGALPGEEATTFQERRLAAAAAEQNTEPPKPLTLKERRAQAKAEKEAAATKADEAFEPLPEQSPSEDVSQNSRAAVPEPERATKARTPAEDEELPEKGPAPVTAQTLAERRQAAFDKAFAAKVGGKEPAPKPAKEPATEARVPEQVPEKVEETPTQQPAEQPAAPKPNRFAVIREAAEKRRLADEARTQAPPRQEMTWAAQDPDSEAITQRFSSFDEAKAWKEAHPEHDIVQVPAELPKASAGGSRGRGEALELHRDNPGGEWLEGKKQLSNESGRRPVGAPKSFGTVTGTFNRTVRVPIDKVAAARGLNDEQNNVRQDSLEGLKQHMAGGELPAMHNGEEYAPFVMVDQNGRGWVNEGNHRIMAAKALGWTHVPVEVRYFNGGENVPGAWHPDTLSKDDRALENTPRTGEAPKANAAPSDDEAAFRRDMLNRMRPGKAEVEQAAAPILRQLRDSVRRNVNIHENWSDLPPHLRDDAHLTSQFGPDGAAPRGVYDPQTKQVHIIAKSHYDVDDATRTLVHELAHLGNRNVIRDYDGVMQSIFKHIHNNESPLNSHLNGKTDKVTARQWMKDYADQHGLDLKNPNHQNHVADEYVAHLADHHFAEPGHENAGILKRFVQWMRGALHDMGFKLEWTDQDILDLARRNNTLLRDIRPDVAEREDQMAPRWATGKADTDPTLHPSDPEAMAAKFGRTMQEQASSGPGTVRSRGDFLGIKGKLTQADAATMSGRLAFLHLDSLPDIVRGMTTVREFVKTVGAMTGRSGRLMQQGADIGLKWSRWANGGIFRDPATGKLTTRKGQEDGGRTLNDIMHSSTLAGIHPDRPYEPLFTGDMTPDQRQVEAQHKELHRRLSDMYNKKLDDEGREIYQKVKQFYEDRRADVLRGLEARINETGASAETKKQAMADLRKKFESGRVKGPYFPLARFGDYWARATDPTTGEHAFSRFENVVQRKQWLENAKANGYDIEQGTRMSDSQMVDRIDPDFVKSVMKATEGHADLQDEIWQHYLKSMPEMSIRKNYIHRKGVLGYSEDALRAFNYNAFHQSHQIARLEYGNRLDSMVNSSEKQADQISAQQPDSNNARWAPEVAKELRKRLEWIKNPKAGSLASGLTKLGYNWFIGASPATAIRISTQNAMLAEPYLAARASKWGLGYFTAARGELWRAVGQWTMAKGNLGDKLRGDERAMFDEAQARGTFMSTASQTLAAGGADRPIGVGPMDAWNRVSSFMFNAMEHKNRQTTALAMYRLARRAGLNHEDATEEAIDASNKAHFNYNNYNRPRVMQNDAVKVIGLFKQYPWQVTDRLARSFRDGVMRNPELSVAERNEQLKAFAGYMGKMMLFAGIKGVPILYHATMAAINAAYSDEDKKFDAQAALREHLEQSIGKTASDAVMDGPMSAATGAALSHGASYSDLWYKQPDRDLNAAETYADLLGQIGGPIPSIGTEAAKGVDIISRTGDIERGAEHFTPPFINHLLKANRMRQEGVTNLRGEQVVSPEEMGQGWATDLTGMQLVRQKNLMLQALGFSPEVVARQYEKNTSENNFKQALVDRQKELTERYDNAVLRGDNDEAIAWMQKMIKFHQANPGMPWSASSIQNGIRGEAKGRALADHGVNMAPGMRQQYEQMTGAQQ